MNANQPVLNLDAPFVDLKTGKLLSPWNMFFQQFNQEAQPIVVIDIIELNTGFIPNALGVVYLEGPPVNIILTRGDVILNLDVSLNFIPMSIGDKIQVVGTTARFIPQR